MQTVSVLLNDADFHTAERMAEAINLALGSARAHAVDSRRVEIVPGANEDRAALLDTVEAVEVEVYPRARVVVNERTGTVVIGGTVRLQPVSILHGGLSVNVVSQPLVSQPGPFSNGTTQVVQQTSVQAQDKPVNRIDLKEGRDGRGSGPGIAANRGRGARRDLDPAGDEGSRCIGSGPGGAMTVQMCGTPIMAPGQAKTGTDAMRTRRVWCGRRMSLKRR